MERIVCSPSDTLVTHTTDAQPGHSGDNTRANCGVAPGCLINSVLQQYSFSNNTIIFRTDGYDNHVNGEGNFGFCSPGCASDYNVGERSKFSSVVDLNDGDYDAINLPVENSAVVFDDETEEESIIVLPPN